MFEKDLWFLTTSFSRGNHTVTDGLPFGTLTKLAGKIGLSYTYDYILSVKLTVRTREWTVGI